MFKLIVLSAFVALAVAAPKPGLYHEQPLLAAPLLASPVTKIVQPAPLLVESQEHVGSYLSHVPTGVSAYSNSVVHGTSPVVSQVVTPVHKTIVQAPQFVEHIEQPVVTVAKSFAPAPIYKSFAAPAPIYKSFSAPTLYAAQPSLLSAPIHQTYAAAPAFSYSHAPIAYNSPIW